MAPSPYWCPVPGPSDAAAQAGQSLSSERGTFEEPFPEMLQERSSPDKEKVSGRRKLKAEGGGSAKALR